ncbi:MAG TPA: HIT family protein [Casimicrobiaceae bacterium]|nr:HIT family protein [Casimicrobiaceae bacterium]
MNAPDTECPFCNVRAPILADELAFVIYDKYPVSPGHALIVPRRHIESFFDATPYEFIAMFALLNAMRRRTDAKLAPDGYNIGVNVGEAAGQTVHHLHMHLIPRFHGDMQNPRGGVRGVIPARQSY